MLNNWTGEAETHLNCVIRLDVPHFLANTIDIDEAESDYAFDTHPLKLCVHDNNSPRPKEPRTHPLLIGSGENMLLFGHNLPFAIPK